MFEIPVGQYACRRAPVDSIFPAASVHYEVRLGTGPWETFRHLSATFDSAGLPLRVLEFRTSSADRVVTTESLIVQFQPDASTKSLRLRHVVNTALAPGEQPGDAPAPDLNDATSAEIQSARKLAAWIWERRRD